MIHLEVEDLTHVAERVLGTVEVRDFGLIASAVARPQSSAFGEHAYPTIHHKAAALIHSIARNRALVDGNKRQRVEPRWPAERVTGIEPA